MKARRHLLKKIGAAKPVGAASYTAVDITSVYDGEIDLSGREYDKALDGRKVSMLQVNAVMYSRKQVQEVIHFLHVNKDCFEEPMDIIFK